MKRLIKLMSIALCMLLVLSTALASVFALSMNGVSLTDTEEYDESERADTDAKLFKDESVYVIANADGTVEKIIVATGSRTTRRRIPSPTSRSSTTSRMSRATRPSP